MIGRNLGDYRILAKFHLGERGLVYKAVHTTQRQTYLLKLLRGELDRANPIHHQFLEDIQLATYLDHPNILRILSLEFQAGFIIIPSDLAFGHSVSRKVGEGRSSVEFVLKCALQAAEALSTAHNSGLIHSQLTSNNLIVTPEGDLKILEFGMASLPEDLLFQETGEGLIEEIPVQSSAPPLSRFAYLAPEQTMGYKAEASTDLYALGLILYELLIGEYLYLGDNIQDLFHQIRQRELPKLVEIRPGIPRSFGKVISSLIEKDPSKRYPSAEFLLDDLRKINHGDSLEHLSFQPKDPSYSRRSFFRRFVKNPDS